MRSFTIIRKLNLCKSHIEFEIMSGDSYEVILTAIETNSSVSQKIMRLLNIPNTSFNFDFFSNTGEKLFTIHKGFTWFASRTNILDANNHVIGILVRNLFGVNGDKYKLMTENDRLILKIKFESGTLNYKFMTDTDQVFAKVIRESDEIREKQKEIVAKSDPLHSIYFMSTTIDVNIDLVTLWLLVSAVVGIDLAFMGRVHISLS